MFVTSLETPSHSQLHPPHHTLYTEHGFWIRTSHVIIRGLWPCPRVWCVEPRLNNEPPKPPKLISPKIIWNLCFCNIYVCGPAEAAWPSDTIVKPATRMKTILDNKIYLPHGHADANNFGQFKLPFRLAWFMQPFPSIEIAVLRGRLMRSVRSIEITIQPGRVDADHAATWNHSPPARLTVSDNWNCRSAWPGWCGPFRPVEIAVPHNRDDADCFCQLKYFSGRLCKWICFQWKRVNFKQSGFIHF